MRRVFQNKRWSLHPFQPGLLWQKVVWLSKENLTLDRALDLTISIIPLRVRRQNVIAVTSVRVTIRAGCMIQFSTGINRRLEFKSTRTGLIGLYEVLSPNLKEAEELLGSSFCWSKTNKYFRLRLTTLSPNWTHQLQGLLSFRTITPSRPTSDGTLTHTLCPATNSGDVPDRCLASHLELAIRLLFLAVSSSWE